MAERSIKFILTSIEEGDKSEKIASNYRWTLERYVATIESEIRRSIFKPTEDLGLGITLSLFIEEMDAFNCFDFEFVPKDKDLLTVSHENGETNRQYFSLIYQANKWESGAYYHYKIPKVGQKVISEKLALGNVLIFSQLQ